MNPMLDYYVHHGRMSDPGDYAGLVRDLAALNKMELLPWDCWGVVLHEALDDPGDLQMLDEVAALVAGTAPDWEAVRARYQAEGRLRAEGTLFSYVDGRMAPVSLE